MATVQVVGALMMLIAAATSFDEWYFPSDVPRGSPPERNTNWKRPSRQNEFVDRRPWQNNIPDEVEDYEDKFIFDRPTRPTTRRPTSTTAPPTTSKVLLSPSPCELRCHRFITTEYNPVCGNDGLTYTNPAKFECGKRCGRSVNMKFFGACSRPLGTI